MTLENSQKLRYPHLTTQPSHWRARSTTPTTMSRQGLTLLGLGGGTHNPITHIRPVRPCMRTPLDKIPQLTTVRHYYQSIIQIHCCQVRHSNNRQFNHLNNLRKRTVHTQTVQWRLHNHNKSLRHRRLAIHLFHHRQVIFFFTAINYLFFCIHAG